MSQSLIVYKGSGQVCYQYNSKVSPFNEFIYHIVNESVQTLDGDVVTTTVNNKRFYGTKRNQLHVALYFDSVTTLDSDKIKATLSGVAKTYEKYQNGEIPSTKMKELIDLQFTRLMSMKFEARAEEETTESTRETSPTAKSTSASTSSKKPTNKAAAGSGKKMRRWVDGELVEHGHDANLDFSANKEAADYDAPLQSVDNSNFVRDKELVLVNELNEILNAKEDTPDDSTKKSGFLSKLSGYFGGQVDIDAVSKKFQDQLVAKNVAPPMAKQITDKLATKFKGGKVTLAQYKQALVDELTKTLTPNVSTDLLYEIKKKQSGPFVISVVGVNGVGKSTNLAKLAYWFLQNNLNVLICACDTFRSGAVEQLNVHVNNLARLNQSTSSTAKIELFEKGYGSGDHVVATAKAAIEYGGANDYDVVLIDTAGRSHANSRLMAPLKKFGDAANPDRIIMVGEALVGTDSVEQAQNFNNAFGNRRHLDFFIISKVDTVGEMVGTMINMVMATKVPILFVGTGQTYTDIKRLSTKAVVDMLMS
ncbi:hypothetical protein DIURU_003193 [Diutina rugosa]|uniref:Signal recognition particle receptor subunit alpha homolog n=1 Tax=Diutina rugosa TaxID=5481 RepID=A0A642UR59_DIURU|nr:uncharacterized protein DIURU_003193 [Diutina rugosa]KAA8901484.1 hypothetical protein DIURU_003193 [Diutina rugosa]